MSLFVNHYKYSIDQFDRLTPVQANLILYDRQQIQKSELEFWQNELRNISFFTIKSSMGDTSKIKTPQDLYRLSSESEKAIEHKPIVMTEDDFKFLKSFLKNQS